MAQPLTGVVKAVPSGDTVIVMGVDASRCVAFEDVRAYRARTTRPAAASAAVQRAGDPLPLCAQSVTGIDSARNAGMPVVVVAANNNNCC